MTKRRDFITASMATIGAALLPDKVFGRPEISFPTDKVLAKRLKKGDTIGLIAPGYAVKPEVLNEAVSTLKNLGFRPFYTHRIKGNHGYFSNTDQERANDLNQMFSDSKIDGILCARGGYGCTRIMQMIDYENIRKHPKALIGFSDITAFLNGIYQETGLITFHGPVGSTLNDTYSIKQFKKVLMQPKEALTIENIRLSDPKIKENPEYERYVITEGTAAGKLVGGNLSLINAMVGTPYAIDFTDKIVCIEDVEEAPYRIDRMLTQLIEGKTFSKAAGIVFGVFAGCNESTNPDSFSLKEVILDRIKPLGIPSVYGMSFGHIENNFTFPIGIRAELDTTKMTLKLLEKAVL